MKRKLSAIFLAYVFLLLTMLRWHFSHEATHLQPTLGLFVVFAVSGALAGLMSVWAALGALHWAKRLPSFVVAVAVFIGGWLLFVDWNKNAIWEMVLLILAQMVFLVGILGCLRILGTTIENEHQPRHERPTTQLSLYDSMLLTASLAILFAVLRFAQPMDTGATLYAVIVAGGACAAFITLITLWAAFSNSSLLIRSFVFLAFAPIGGLVYAIARRYIWLYFDSQWYAGVTFAQMTFMILPLALIRAHGFCIKVSGADLHRNPKSAAADV